MVAGGNITGRHFSVSRGDSRGNNEPWQLSCACPAGGTQGVMAPALPQLSHPNSTAQGTQNFLLCSSAISPFPASAFLTPQGVFCSSLGPSMERGVMWGAADTARVSLTHHQRTQMFALAAAGRAENRNQLRASAARVCSSLGKRDRRDFTPSPW